MTNLEQLLIIVKKEMRSKELLMSHDANTKATKNYWQGGLSVVLSCPGYRDWEKIGRAHV